MDAPESPVEGLQKVAVCSICLEFFKDPVSIECGHNFCRVCITQCCEESRRHFCCPHCRRRACKRDFRPNRELASMVELAKRFKLEEEVKTAGEKGECEAHQEPLKLFCEDDQILICVVCDRSKEHRSHTVTPVEEAAVDYKEQIQNQSQTLKQEKERLQDLKQASERSAEEYLENLDAERKKMTSKFELLHQFLEEMEQLLLDQLDVMEMDVRKGQKESDVRFSEEISILEDLINEMDENCKQAASEFLQNVKKMLNRSKEEPNLPMEISQDLKAKLGTFYKKNISLEKILKKFKDILTLELQGKGEDATVTIGVQTDQEKGVDAAVTIGVQTDQEKGVDAAVTIGVQTDQEKGVDATVTIGVQTHQEKGVDAAVTIGVQTDQEKEAMTLDLDTAGPYLILSDNGKSVKLGDTRQKRASSRDPMNVYPCVLGSKGFSSGKHCWEVLVVEGGCWAVGVAKGSVKKKKKLDFRPEEGIWALEHLGFDHYRALTSPPTPLPLSKAHQIVQVCLDYEAGQVAFFDVEQDTCIFTFSSISFGGEVIYPWLWVGMRSQLRLCP
ncbi:E3 ubiquitin-protein ligase TRIM39-like isoform X1 [Heteronotia binoei]|uniref:E3 ubiquitin-protein ligase TRIM39-like isoform X1 n=1 Tax=Heteronotia binoei TaxID=13085 RepID=UPI0029307D81|nr:E3 ubiquitin-protein ligase TRIM39-like isoform X1 [Heteronotia binoei]